MKHFEEAMKKIRPLSNQELSMYKTIAQQFGKPELTDGWRKKMTSDVNSPSIA
jgi:transitional endoplasmic reticulum ATPase